MNEHDNDSCAPEFNLGLHELHIAQFIVFCRSLFVFFLLSIVFSVFNLCLLITTLVCQIFLMIISTHFNNMFSKWFLYVFAQFTTKWFHPYTQLSGTYGRRTYEIFIYFFFVRSTTFLLNVQARDIVKSWGTNLHWYQYLRVGCVFDLSSKSIGWQSDRSLQREATLDSTCFAYIRNWNLINFPFLNMFMKFEEVCVYVGDIACTCIICVFFT